jgi:short-subunit dehydrogenase
MTDRANILWITGATSGIGESLARLCPWPDTEIISVSRRPHPDFETVPFELTEPRSWDAVGAHVAERLETFRGERALFIHNALLGSNRAYQGEGDHDRHVTELMANCVAAMALGDYVIRAAAPAVEAGVDVGLVQMTSMIAAAGYAIYGASKAAIEQWVHCVRAEREDRGQGPWVTAIRPGFVATPSVRREAELPPGTHPGSAAIAEALRSGAGVLSPDESAEQIWGAIPDLAKRKPLLYFGKAVDVAG